MSDTDTKPTNVADVEEAMRDVVDPELGINVVDLGLVYGITVDAQNHAAIEDQVQQSLEGLVETHRCRGLTTPFQPFFQSPCWASR